MKYFRVPIVGDAVVVAFDLCSSSDMIEDLTLSGNLGRFKGFLTSLKEYLASAQKKILFDPYKFTGDGWILLFPADTDGRALLEFLRDLCVFVRKDLKKRVVQYLGTTPSVTGVRFGVEKGPLVSVIMYGQTEYLGRAINVACRLQNAVGDKGGPPAYKALVSNVVFTDYFAPAKKFTVYRVKRTLKNIRHGAEYKCRKIELLG